MIKKYNNLYQLIPLKPLTISTIYVDDWTEEVAALECYFIYLIEENEQFDMNPKSKYKSQSKGPEINVWIYNLITDKRIKNEK